MSLSMRPIGSRHKRPCGCRAVIRDEPAESVFESMDPFGRSIILENPVSRIFLGAASLGFNWDSMPFQAQKMTEWMVERRASQKCARSNSECKEVAVC